MAKKFKLGYLCLALTFVVGIVNLIHIRITTSEFGAPNSLDGSVSWQYNQVSMILAITGSPIGLILLIYEVGNQWTASGFWLTMIGGSVTTLVTIVRSTAYFVNSDDHYKDFVNYTTIRELDGKPISKQFVGVTRKFQCCGVMNLLDWELIIYALANVDAASRRYLPDMCCRNQVLDCGNSISDEINQISRNPDPISNDEFSNWNPQFKKLVTAKINIENDTKEMGRLFGDEICKKNAALYSKNEIVFYQEDFAIVNGGVITLCDAAKAAIDPSCKQVRTTTVKSGKEFCLWKNKRFIDYNYEKLLRLYIKDDRLFTTGCLKHLEPYVFTVCLSLLFYSLLMIAGFLSSMGFFHCYFWEFKDKQMDEDLQPRWYVQLANEKNPIRGFGDVSHVPNANPKP